MQSYAYTARDERGKLVKGTLSCESELSLTGVLRQKGLVLTSAKPVIVIGGAGKTVGGKSRKKGHLNSVELLNLTTQMAISLDSGVPLLASLKDLVEGTPSPKIKTIVEDIVRSVESGRSFKDALNDHPKSFPKLYISIVGAGESTGKLPLVLNDLAKLIDWQLDLGSRIKEASIYPVILFSTMIMVVTVLVTVVIPKFEPMFAELKVALPLPTQVVMGLSRFSRNYWWVAVLTGIISVVTYNIANSKEKGRYIIDKWKLKLPLAGPLLEKVALSRFCHTFALSLRSGVNVFSALGIASEVTGNAYFEKLVVKARDYVNVGEKISTALKMSGKFPYLVVRMIAVGEQTGSLSESLERVNQFYDKEVPAAIKKMFALFEPLMIVFMGVVVGGIAMSVFLPLIKIIGSIGE